VVERLYTSASSLGWEGVSPGDRTAQYAIWLEDPEIGGVLQQYMTIDRARVWLKDGPMKEYARARMGVGKYSALVRTGRAEPAALVRQALGEGWELVPGTTGIKPLHATAARGDERVNIFWGPVKDFKHLLWAALEAMDDPGAPPATVIVIETLAQPATTAEKHRQTRFAQRCGFSLAHIRI